MSDSIENKESVPEVSLRLSSYSITDTEKGITTPRISSSPIKVESLSASRTFIPELDVPFSPVRHLIYTQYDYERLRTSFPSVIAENDYLKGIVENQRKDIYNLVNRLKDLGDIPELKRQAAFSIQLATENETLRHKMAMLAAENDRLAALFQNQLETNEVNRKKTGELEVFSRSVSLSYDELKIRYQELVTAINELRNQNANLIHDNNELALKISDLVKFPPECERLRALNEDLRKQLEFYVEENRTLNNKVLELSPYPAECARQKETIADLRAQIEKYVQEIHDLTEKVRELSPYPPECAQQKVTIADLKAQIEKYLKQIQELTDKVNELTPFPPECARQKEIIADLRAQVEKQQKEIQDLTEKVRELTPYPPECAKQKEIIADLRAQIEKYLKQIQDLTEKVKELSPYPAECARLNEIVNNQKAQIAQLLEEVRVLTIKVEDLSKYPPECERLQKIVDEDQIKLQELERLRKILTRATHLMGYVHDQETSKEFTGENFQDQGRLSKLYLESLEKINTLNKTVKNLNEELDNERMSFRKTIS